MELYLLKYIVDAKWKPLIVQIKKEPCMKIYLHTQIVRFYST